MKSSRPVVVTLTLLATLTVAWPRIASAADPIINGVNAAKLGMPSSMLKQFYPNAYEQPVPTPKPGERVPPFTMPRYTISGQTVGPLTDCALDCQFFNDYLFQVYVQCPQARSEIEAYLEKEYGKPGIKEGPVKQWLFDTRVVSYTEASGMFLVEDKVMSQKVNMTLMNFISGGAVVGAPEMPAAEQPKAPDVN